MDEAMLSCFGPQGFGTLLMEEAERIAREEHGSVKLAVISGTWPLVPLLAMGLTEVFQASAHATTIVGWDMSSTGHT